MEKNNIYDIISLIKNPVYFNNDMEKSISALREGLENTYTKKIYQMAETEKEKVNSAPPREVVLLRAIKNFASPAFCRNIDNAINIINTFTILNSINNSIYSQTPSINMKSDESGINYSPKTLTAAADILMLMALTNRL